MLRKNLSPYLKSFADTMSNCEVMAAYVQYRFGLTSNFALWSNHKHA